MEIHERNLDQLAGKRNVFSVPVNYFDHFPSRMRVIVQERDEYTEEEDPHQDAIRFESLNQTMQGIDMQEAYFDKLHSRIVARIVDEGTDGAVDVTQHDREPLITGLWSLPVVRQIVRLGAAASLVGLLIFSGIRWAQSGSQATDTAKGASEERFLSRYDIDESTVENELVMPQAGSRQSEPSLKAVNGATDSYILEHADAHSLMEEI